MTGTVTGPIVSPTVDLGERANGHQSSPPRTTMVEVQVARASPPAVVSSVRVVDHRVAAGRADLVDGEGAQHLVTGGDRPVVDETLLAVDDAAVVDACLGVLDVGVVGGLREPHGQRRRGDDVAVPGGTGRVGVGVDRVLRADRGREGGDERGIDGIRPAGRVGASDEVGVHGHVAHSRAGPHRAPNAGHARGRRHRTVRAASWSTRWGQRVSRCAVCDLQRGQNFASSIRSGSLRRFFFVM